MKKYALEFIFFNFWQNIRRLYFKFNKKAEKIDGLRGIIKILKSHIGGLNDSRLEIDLDIKDASIYILEENLDALESVIILYKKKYYKSCLILARNILESSANLIYIYSRKHKKRASTYLSFSLISIKENLENCTDDCANREDVINRAKIILDNNYFPEGKNGLHWNGLTVKRIFEEIKMNSLYKDYYSQLSKYIHNNYKPGIDLEEQRPYSQFLSDLIFKHLPLVILESIKRINDKYDLREGGVIMPDYPKKGTVLFFCINHKRMPSREEQEKLFKNNVN